MTRNVFYSFHYKPDNWRASQVRNMGLVEGNKPCSDNDWEQVTKGGDTAIKKWIAGQLDGRSCTVVLIGTGTRGRKWIKYEIERSWSEGKGLLGIYVHHVKDANGNQTLKGGNPFDEFQLNGKNLADIVKAYDPPYMTSKDAYDYIRSNLADWIEEAIRIRNNA